MLISYYDIGYVFLSELLILERTIFTLRGLGIESIRITTVTYHLDPYSRFFFQQLFVSLNAVPTFIELQSRGLENGNRSTETLAVSNLLKGNINSCNYF